MRFSDVADGTMDALRNAGSYLSDLATPTVRLGVTGLARSGKTVFIAALIRSLTGNARLPFFRPYAEGRIVRAYLQPQPDDAVPRFDYEAHVAALSADPPRWPDSTRRISELRVTVEYAPSSAVWRALSFGRLQIDIVDYPGEWLIDLGLIDQSYEEWSRQAIALASDPVRQRQAEPWLRHLAGLNPDSDENEQSALTAARIFTDYLKAARATHPSLSTLGPGRFLLPGDLEGSPLLTFVPLANLSSSPPRRGSLAAMMARRYESYKSHVVKPFFRDHFSRLDRQIVLVDALEALNAGGPAIEDLARALEMSLRPFRPGARSWLASVLGRRIDRVVFAATKADHLPSSSHDRLEATLRFMTDEAARRVAMAGASVHVLAMAAIRATREVEARERGERLACIKGVPLAGEVIGRKRFDGRTEVAIFPGDLPADPRQLLTGENAGKSDVRFVRFLPPRFGESAAGPATWPHVRLDRALQLLLGDYLS